MEPARAQCSASSKVGYACLKPVPWLLLRPFFDVKSSQLALDSSFSGSAPGACQEYNDETHPHLQLDRKMVSMPKVEPGDYVAWHCDTIRSVDKEHQGRANSSVCVIFPFVP